MLKTSLFFICLIYSTLFAKEYTQPYKLPSAELIELPKGQGQGDEKPYLYPLDLIYNNDLFENGIKFKFHSYVQDWPVTEILKKR